MELKHKFLIDTENRKVAIQFDLDTFEVIEDILENYGLVKLMSDDENDAHLNLEEAKRYYAVLEKSE